jgi:hypothetical protein
MPCYRDDNRPVCVCVCVRMHVQRERERERERARERERERERERWLIWNYGVWGLARKCLLMAVPSG